ncbi:MAG: 50S ribosomal protein L24 [Pirellulales bacterium]|nr:50S ribosomal protein L24 [Pirellulales bacterium]
MHLRVEDMVEVRTGDDRGTRARILKVLPDAGKVVVEGVNRVYKHVRRSQRNPQGGRLSKEMPIRVANVLLVCKSCGAATRTGARYLDDGSKERFCKSCGAGNGQVAPARARYAKSAKK